MTAGVQNLESAAHLPPPPSTSPSGAPAARSAGRHAADTQAPDRQAANAQGERQDFRSELERQATRAKETKARSAKSGTAKSGSAKPGSAKQEKPRDKAADDPNLSVVTPVQAAEPPKQTQPIGLALPAPNENVQPEDNAKLYEPGALLSGLPPTVAPAQSAAPPVADVPVLPETANSGDPSTLSGQPGAPSENQSAPRAELRLPDATPEPAATAVQETVDAASSSPAALAFAARMAATPPKSDGAVPDDPSQPPAVPGSPTLAQIPVRYAATAQILQNAGAELKRDAGAATDHSARTDTRTDMVLPRIEPAHDAAPSSGSAAPQPNAPTAHMEPVLEPPAAPPNSSHDIRVRVPDDNGGSTQLRFVESGGEVRVSVRTADEGLAQNLRSHLNDLSQRLGDAGIPAEIWKPGAAAASSHNNQHQPDREGRGSGGQQSGDQSSQQERQQKRPAWLEEMETSLYGTNQ